MRQYAKFGVGVVFTFLALVLTLGIYFDLVDNSILTREGQRFAKPLVPVPARQAMPNDVAPKRVAIIGAGAGGSSTAYFLRKFAEKANQPVHISIYERNDYVGGRTTTVNVYNDPSKPAELGGSIFVEVNHIMVNASKDLGLETKELLESESGSTDAFGVWNGESFVFRSPDSPGWYDNVKIILKYGLAPIRIIRLMQATVGRFLNMYSAPIFPFKSLTEVVETLGLKEATGFTGDQFLVKHGVAGQFAKDVVQASTRVNYAQNLGLIHGLETMVCMATNGAMAIKGGNWRIFNAMIETAKADLHLNTTVTGIKRAASSTWQVTSSSTRSKSNDDKSKQFGGVSLATEEYDAVVLAGPYQYSGLDLEKELEKTPDKIPYVKLYVTLFTSPYKLSKEYFGLSPEDQVPNTVLTTLNATEENDPKIKQSSFPDRVGNAGFFSISCHGKQERKIEGSPNLFVPEYLYKIFSAREFSDDDILKLLDVDAGQSGEESISWIHRKTWHSYPFEYPRVTFEDFVLDKEETFFYTSGIESFISTMETSSLAGMNVAQLIVNSWLNAADSSAVEDQPSIKPNPIPVAGELKARAKL